MPRKSRYRYSAIALSMLMLVSASGFTLDLHYCQGRVKSFSVFGRASGCIGKDSAVMTCAHRKSSEDHGRDAIERQACCDNKLHYFQSAQDQIAPASDIGRIDQHMQAVPGSLTGLTHSLVTSRAFMHARYRPPPLYRDIPVLIQTFRL